MNATKRGRRIANFGADDLAVPANLTGRLRYLDLRGEGAPLWGPSGEALHLAALGGLTTVGPARAGHVQSPRRAAVGGGFAGRGLRR